MKPLFLGLLLSSLSCSGSVAQTISSGDSFGADSQMTAPSPSPGAEGGKKKGDEAQAPQGPTVIDSEAMDYNEKTRIAIFTGANYGVFVKDPSFTVYCDKLTAYMRKAAGATPGGISVKGKATPSPIPRPAPRGQGTPAPARGNGLQSAFAEGTPDRPVVIVQDKPAANGEQAQHNVGIAANAYYNADTGDVSLYGWPRVSQGINTQIATSEKTIMTMNKDGRTMKTIGPSHTVIQEQEQPKKTGTDSEAPAENPARLTQ